MNYLYNTILASVLFFNTQAFAADIKWSEIRLFGTTNSFTNTQTDLDNLTSADKTPSLTQYTGYGLEAYGQMNWFKFGFRYKGAWASLTPDNSTTPATAFLHLQQAGGGPVLRIALINQDWLLLDIFGEVGSTNTTIDVLTKSSGSGTFSKNGTIYERAGASLGIGWSSFKLYVEAGKEWNKVDTPTFTGTLSNSITSIDLSGTYIGFGMIIVGVPSWFHITGGK